MSQWGTTRIFCQGDTRITALPHVKTRGFDPLTADAKIDDVMAIEEHGPNPDALAEEVRRRYRGKPYREWLRVA